jgi:hypothetical protein
MVLRPSKPYFQSPGVPNYAYDSMLPMWRRSRAILNGEQAVKEHDSALDTVNFTNLLVPFSDRMSLQQYKFYLAEAELPGLVSQYARVIVGGLLRKTPQFEFSSKVPEEAYNWIENNFTSDNRSLISFLDEALWEETTSSRAFVMIDYPDVGDTDSLSSEDKAKVKPYPVLWRAENVINWAVSKNKLTGAKQLSRVMISYFKEELVNEEDFHPELVEYVADHRIDKRGYYYVCYYRRKSDQTVRVTNGMLLPYNSNNRLARSVLGTSPGTYDDDWEKVDDDVYPMMNGEYMTRIPGFFLNGSVHPREPVLMPLVDREVALYNKMSRRNHLLYTASTFTPVFMTSVSDDAFEEIVQQGLGTYIRLNPEDKVDALKTPTDALGNLDKAIDHTVSELARMGVRMLSPEGGSQSGIALEIRNSAQTSQLATLNVKISQVMKSIVAMMLEWKYGVGVTEEDIEFTLSADFNPSPIGESWIRLVSEWYESGIIPRSLFIDIAKQNDVIPAEYDDEIGRQEMAENPVNPLGDTNLDPDFPEELFENARPTNDQGS